MKDTRGRGYAIDVPVTPRPQRTAALNERG